MINATHQRFETWYFSDEHHLIPRHPAVISNRLDTQLQAALAGKAAVLLLEWLVREPLSDGRLQELLPELPRPSWPLYLYRPSRNVTPQHVKASRSPYEI